MSDPRVHYFKNSFEALKTLSEIPIEAQEWWGNLQIAQVYATLAAVPAEVLVGLELESLETHYRSRDLQEKFQKDVSEKLSGDGDG